ncbi:hypothetical protein VE00_05593 [Pseudogymnoascus sp. WSF 3629]|nr:hypothetical protein VE00_05593 [Pseudogymnoascus sp. WSF 3629]
MISRLLPDLRAQLAAVINNPPNQHQSQQQQQQQQHPHHQPPPPHLIHGYNDVASNSASPHNIDPAIAGAAHAHHALDMMGGSAGGDSGDDNGDGRKGGKRELSQSKRAAQNRAAQRAFRQRKEGYIKKLEEQVRELHTLEDNYKVIQNENYSLRDYILQLQRRLLESQGEYPQPPAAVSVLLNHPHQHQQHEAPRRGPDPTPPAAHAPTAVMGQAPDQVSGGSSLQSQMAPLQAQLQASAAQAVADLRESAAKQRQVQEEYLARGTYKGEGEGAAEEELSRQLQGSADIPGGMGGM